MVDPTAPVQQLVGWALFDKNGHCTWGMLHTVDPALWAANGGNDMLAQLDARHPDRAPHVFHPVYRNVGPMP